VESGQGYHQPWLGWDLKVMEVTPRGSVAVREALNTEPVETSLVHVRSVMIGASLSGSAAAATAVVVVARVRVARVRVRGLVNILDEYKQV
jgi:hypothetical protein